MPHLPFALLLLALCGCAAQREMPDAGGTPCEEHADCNVSEDGGTQRCGSLLLCVAGYCEVPVDAGAPAARIVSCR